MKNKLTVFILTHGRADDVITYKTLRKCNYTGDIYIIIDNEDNQIDRYKEIYGDKVIVFNKLEMSKKFDTADNFNDRRTIVYARNACFEIAESLGIEYFIELDDDYTGFTYRFNELGEFKQKPIKNLDKILDLLMDFYKNTPFNSIAMSQGGDFIGGNNNHFVDLLWNRRKCMNTIICSTKRKYKFVGRINEDVNTYTSQQRLGLLFTTIPQISMNQKTTQKNKGGMTDVYLENGTYVKSFYSVIFNPSSVKIFLLPGTNRRLHHCISWKKTIPALISCKYKKG